MTQTMSNTSSFIDRDRWPATICGQSLQASGQVIVTTNGLKPFKVSLMECSGKLEKTVFVLGILFTSLLDLQLRVIDVT